MLTSTEENYLKAIYKISERQLKPASTNAISKEINTSAASVTDMLQRLSSKDLLFYEKYKGVTLTASGKKIATTLIRKHRLWEVFLVKKLKFKWDEVHDLAEQLEHIQSSKLVERLDAFLEFPQFDPHGDPIPDNEGQFTHRVRTELSKLVVGSIGTVVGVLEDEPSFLQYLDKTGLVLGVKIEILEIFDFDKSIKLWINNATALTVSSQVANNIFVNLKT